MKKFIFCFLVLSISFGFALTDKQIEQVKKQIHLLEHNNYKDYKRAKANLKSTNIASYLEYKEISLNPDKVSQQQINNYFKNHDNEYWAGELCDDLAIYYAKTKNWKMFKKFYDGDLDKAGRCWEIQKNENISEEFRENAILDFSKHWQTKKYVPSECVDMQKYWQGYANQGRDCIVDKAYDLAIEDNFEGSLDVLNNYAKGDKYVQYIRDWKEVSNNLDKLDTFIAMYSKYPEFNEVIVDLTKDSVKKKPKSYASIWGNLKNKKLIDEKTNAQVSLAIATSLARHHDSEYRRWFDAVDKSYYSNYDWEWLLRVEIYDSAFKAYIDSYDQSPKSIQKESVWKYWLAYSYSKIDLNDKATSIYQKLAKRSFDYYAFLSADALNEKYNLGSNSAKRISKSKITELLKDKNISQAIDLYKSEEYKESAQLWRWVIRQKFKDNRTEIPDLAQLAWLNKMYYQAIFSMGMLGLNNYTELLFPNPFEEMINEQSQKYDLKKSLIFSIIRRESLFNIQASSSVGAKGLMQVTIPTAKFISKRYKLKSSQLNLDEHIFTPDINIGVGTANLNYLDSLFKANIVLSIAAYNAGQGNVAKWLTSKSIPTKQWIENIPFRETRNYIRKVLVNLIVYNNVILKNKNKIRLSNILDGEISSKYSFLKKR